MHRIVLWTTYWLSIFVWQSRCVTRYAQRLLMLLRLLCRNPSWGSILDIPTLLLLCLLIMCRWEWVVQLERVSSLEWLLNSIKRRLWHSRFVRDSRCWFLIYCGSFGRFMNDWRCDWRITWIKFVVVHIWYSRFMSYLLWLVDARWHLFLEWITIFGWVATFVARYERLNIYVLFL